MLDAQVINAVFSGLVLLLGAVGALIGVRARRAGVTRREYRDLQRQHVAALVHIFALEVELARHGRTPPPRPGVLDVDPEHDEPGPVAALPPPPAPDPPEGRHAAT